MTPEAQVPLDLPFRPALGRDDFLVGAANSEAVQWIDQWPNWPGSGLVLYGPEACGKTHLSEVWLSRTGGQRISRDALEETNQTLHAVAEPHLAIEDLDQGFDEEALLHLINQVRQGKGSFLLTARAAPLHWGMRIKDLSSRVLALQATEIFEPDDALLGAVLRKLFEDRQLALREDVGAYLATRIDRSFASLAAIAKSIDSASLASGRAITVPLVRDILEHQKNQP